MRVIMRTYSQVFNKVMLMTVVVYEDTAILFGTVGTVPVTRMNQIRVSYASVSFDATIC